MALFHTVESGESLRAIAEDFYGNEMEWSRIHHEGDPDLIYPGDRLELNPIS